MMRDPIVVRDSVKVELGCGLPWDFQLDISDVRSRINKDIWGSKVFDDFRDVWDLVRRPVYTQVWNGVRRCVLEQLEADDE